MRIPKVIFALLCVALCSCAHSPEVSNKTNTERRDAAILDAILGDALTSKELAPMIQFYGGVTNRTVRYTRFPAGYKPSVPGYRFLPLPRKHETLPRPVPGSHLTIVFSGLWVDSPPPKDEFRSVSDEKPKQGAMLGIYNPGNGTIGECAVGYEIHEIASGWRVRCIGFDDP